VGVKMTRLNRAMSVGGILLLGLTVTCKESKKSSPAPAQQQSPAPCTPTTQTQNPYGTSQGGTNQGYGTSAYGSTGNNTMLLQNGTATGSVVSWLQIEPIIQRSCASCHGPGARNGQYSTYETASKPNVVASVAVKKNMPTSGPLTAQEQQLFTQWQAGGFQRSTSVTAVNGTGSTVNGGTVGGGTVVGGSTTNSQYGYSNNSTYGNTATSSNCYPSSTTPQTYGTQQSGYQTSPNGTQLPTQQQQGSSTQTGF